MTAKTTTLTTTIATKATKTAPIFNKSVSNIITVVGYNNNFFYKNRVYENINLRFAENLRTS